MESVNLPILLVSAKDQEAAATIISEITGNESEVKTNNLDQNDTDCIWRIENKYYSVDVRVLALLDGGILAPDLEDSVEAHLIYLSEDECKYQEVIDVMQQRAKIGEVAQIRLVAAEADGEPAALAAACARARLELVPLRERAGDVPAGDVPAGDVPAGDVPAGDVPAGDEPAGDEPAGDEVAGGLLEDPRGPDRVRAALHAHVWPGLRRHGTSEFRIPEYDKAFDSSDEEWSEWCEGPAPGGAQAPGSEAAFAAALAALPAAAAQARAAARAGGARDGGAREGGAREGGARAERLARAEQLVAAFCHALGAPLD